jgi:ADP-ribose pyrophosphatase YjhB (NUDIX family)
MSTVSSLIGTSAPLGSFAVESRVDCVGGIVKDAAGRLLLILRRNEPAIDCWSVPGGRKEPGESDAEATAREVLEETGLRVHVHELVGIVERDAPGNRVYLIRDYRCSPASDADTSAVRAGDDARDVGWFSPEEVEGLRCSPGLVETLRGWGVL